MRKTSFLLQNKTNLQTQSKPHTYLHTHAVYSLAGYVSGVGFYSIRIFVCEMMIQCERRPTV